MVDDVDYQPSREEKIEGFKEKKALENNIKNLKDIKDEDHQREILLLNIQNQILRTLDDIKSVNQSIQFEDYRIEQEKKKQKDPIEWEK